MQYKNQVKNTYIYSTVYTGHKNATNVTPQQKIHTKIIFKKYKMD